MAKERRRSVGELTDEVKLLKQRNEELRKEIDDQRELIAELREHAEDFVNYLEAWRDTFGMVETDGGWTWEPWWNERKQLIADYNKLFGSGTNAYR
jgi:hypothetical protein